MLPRKERGIYNLEKGRSYSFNYVVDLINEKLGTTLKPIYKENHIKSYVKDTLANTRRQSGSWALRPSGLWKRDWIRSWGREKRSSFPVPAASASKASS